MDPMPDPDFLCCELSTEMNEPMAGTAVTVGVWFMLEYNRLWGADVTTENELPPAVKTWLGAQLEPVNGRLQFIRQFRPPQESLTFFVSVNRESAPRLYEFQLGAYEDLTELDIPALVAGSSRYEAHLVTGHRYFVCTNGRRDRSCAVYGAALYRDFAARAGRPVWMTTHLGGHRFAATLLSLPDGACYGRVRPEEISSLLAASQPGELWLEKLRGRTCYQPAVQVADAWLRQETGQTRLDAFMHRQTVADDGRWQITFQAKSSSIYVVTLAAAAPLPVYANSGRQQTKPVPQYALVGIKTA